jgi:hypothetical protein
MHLPKKVTGMKKPRRKLTASEKAEKRRRRKEYMTIFINGKQKRVKRPPTIDGLEVDEFIRRNADPIWLHPNEIMKQSKFPPGWDVERVNKLLSHYESQSEEEAVAEDESALETIGQTVIEVPTEIVPAVRELIAKHKAA